MSARTLQITPALYEYLMQVGVRESPTAAALRVETRKLPMAMMQISPEQAAFMQLIVKLMGVRRALEVGTFTGYSALAVAEAMGSDGRLIACDVSLEWTSIGKPHWAKAGVAHKIDLRIGPAVTTLDELIAQGQSDTFDFAFIDADKSNYDNYYERALKLVRVRRTDRHRQHAVERRRRRCVAAGRRHAGDPRAEHESARRPAGRRDAAADRRRTDARPPALN